MTNMRFADRFALAVKDQLRRTQYEIRRSASGDGGRSGPRAPRPVAAAADALLSQLQVAATTLMPETERKSANFSFPLPVSAYFGREAEETHAFTSEIYYALKGLLRRFGAAEFLVSEQVVEDVRVRMARRHGGIVAAALQVSGSPAERSQRIAGLCAALAVELSTARPIKEFVPRLDAHAQPKNLLVSPNAYCALVAALSIGVVTQALDEGELDREVVLGSADMAVDACFASLSSALRKREPIAALTAEFVQLMPFLP